MDLKKLRVKLLAEGQSDDTKDELPTTSCEAAASVASCSASSSSESSQEGSSDESTFSKLMESVVNTLLPLSLNSNSKPSGRVADPIKTDSPVCEKLAQELNSTVYNNVDQTDEYILKSLASSEEEFEFNEHEEEEKETKEEAIAEAAAK